MLGEPFPVDPTASNAATQDRDAYFAIAFRLLAEQGCEAVTIAAMCDRLGVTKGSFYHHFGDLSAFLAAFAERLPAWMAATAEAYSGIPDPRQRLEQAANDFLAVTTSAHSAVRAWARTEPVLAAAEEAMYGLTEQVVRQALVEILGDAELGATLAHMCSCAAVGVQLRGPIDPRHLRMLQWETVRRMLGSEAEVELADGRHDLRLLEESCPRYPIDPTWGAPTSTMRWGVDADRPPAAHERPEVLRGRPAYYAAARDLLAEEGFDAVTVAALCARLWVTRGSFHHHFSGMTEFVERLAEHWEAGADAALERHRSRPDPRARLAGLLQQLLAAPDQAEVDWRAWGQAQPVVGAALARVDQRYIELVVDTLQELGTDPDAAALLAETLLCVAIGLQWPRPRTGPDQAARVVLEWTRRVLRVDALIRIERDRPVLVLPRPLGG